MNEKQKEKEKEEAMNFAGSMRGQFIISQALVLAIKSIEARPKERQEPSNVEDMKYLINNIFPIYKVVHEVEAQTMEKLINKDK